MAVARFRDILYGTVEIPDELVPFLRIPEFVRLRSVRLSNVDSYEFKDLNGPTRWEHGVAVAALALRCGVRRGLRTKDLLHLALAGLLHDVATPPFAHTAEYVLNGFDHEIETQNLLSGRISDDALPDLPVFQSELPRFQAACKTLSRVTGVRIDPDEIARMVVGEGDLGYLISGTLDLDNADNVTRACLYMGINVDRRLPVQLADWLADRRSPPIELESVADPRVRLWMSYRNRMYTSFFESSNEELGRQAFLQHLMRRALQEGMPRRTLVWNTDDGLLSAMSAPAYGRSEAGTTSLAELVRRYRLLESPVPVLTLPIEDHETLRSLKLPQAATWVEEQLSSHDFEALAIVTSRRFGSEESVTLFPPAPGALLIFKLGSNPELKQLPAWTRDAIRQLPQWVGDQRINPSGIYLRRALAQVVSPRITRWAQERPWLKSDGRRHSRAVEVLESIGDWSFRRSRNDSFHVYPATFVHAIPASLINALGVRGELVIDPFGGTGQTAVEAIKYGGSAISSDINSVATLVANSRLTFLNKEERDVLRGISRDDIAAMERGDPPDFSLRDAWYHPSTLQELTSIRSFIGNFKDVNVGGFLTACFSAVLNSSTGRKGEQHGFFADNTPLGSKHESPTYRSAAEQFVKRVHLNVQLIERFYAFIEKSDRDPESELNRARVVKLDARKATPIDYGIEPNSAAAIITSPPYLCMTDYSLGNRLSYYWLHDFDLEYDFDREIGARRQRFNPGKAIEAYYQSMAQFGERAAHILREGSYLATVLGIPEAKAFKDEAVLERVDELLKDSGFRLMWSHWRPVYWNRNHGYARLRKERVAVYAFD